MLSPLQVRQVATWIVNAEARRDKQGRIKIYKLPAADGGGSFEVAGINDLYHEAAAHRLANLIRQGQPMKAEEQARQYIEDYTQRVTRWQLPSAAEAYLRDCCWNRGPKGALRILQIALRVADDGKFGPVTRAAITKQAQAPDFLLKLRNAREAYEHRVAPPVGKRAAFWKGLINRFAAALKMAQAFA